MAENPLSVQNPKIDPSRRSGLRPDQTPDDNNRLEIGPTPLAFDEWARAGLQCPDLPAMRQHRLDRLVAGLIERGLAGALLFSPLSIRYATDTTNMQVNNFHDPFRACLVMADGHMVLWDFAGHAYMSQYNPLVKEVRSGAAFYYFAAGDRSEEVAEAFAHQVDGLLKERAGSNRRLAVDKIQIVGLWQLDKLGIQVEDGDEFMELMKAVKGTDEILAMRCAVHACDQSIAEMRAATAPGMTENDVWAELHKANIRRGGEWIETRLLSSGPRTNPWQQECGPRVIQENELLAFDTDLVGCYGMSTDISRTWFVGDGQPTVRQKDMHSIAYEHIMTNAELLRPGATFRELAEHVHQLPAKYVPQRYTSCFHGVGLSDEWPAIRYGEDWENRGYDGVLEPGMVMCVEAYIGEVGGPDGVKLENQLLITESGSENLSQCPFDPKLMDRS